MSAQPIGAAPVPMDVLIEPAETVAAYERFLARTGLSANTKRSYTSQVRGFLAWLGQQDKHRLDEVFTDQHTRDYAVRDYNRWLLTEAKRKPKTVDQALTAVGSLYSWVGLGVPDAPKVAGRAKHAPKHLTVDQVRDVLRAAERRKDGVRDTGLVATATLTGLRVSEIAALDLDDVWITPRAGEVQVRAGKGDKPRTVPLNSQVRGALGKWLALRNDRPAQGDALFLTRQGRRMQARTIHYAVSETGKAAGVHLSPHVLRHTFAATLIREGVDPVLVAEMMGHASLETVRIYSRPTKQEAATALEVLHIDY